jgi:hypothetical protein
MERHPNRHNPPTLPKQVAVPADLMPDGNPRYIRGLRAPHRPTISTPHLSVLATPITHPGHTSHKQTRAADNPWRWTIRRRPSLVGASGELSSYVLRADFLEIALGWHFQLLGGG